MTNKEPINIPVWKKYSLSVKEAAQYFGIGEKRLYKLIKENPNENFILEIGSNIRIKREKLEEYLNNSNVV